MDKADITRFLYKAALHLRKHAPEILIGVGITGVVTSTVLACKATTKLEGVIEDGKQRVNDVHERAEHIVNPDEQTEKEIKKDLAMAYVHTGLQVAKLYAPSVLLGAASLGSIITSHSIINKRNVALAAAYASIDKGFKDYRKRVVERFGNELDKELKYNLKAKEIEEKVVNENGEEKTVKKTVYTKGPGNYSVFARIYDCGCKGWTKNPEENLYYLNQLQNWMNEKLRDQGYLFLNEVYEELGIQRSQLGQQFGWVYKKDGETTGDNYVDFGIYNVYDEQCANFVNGIEPVIILDFNVDGNILDILA